MRYNFETRRFKKIRFETTKPKKDFLPIQEKLENYTTNEKLDIKNSFEHLKLGNINFTTLAKKLNIDLEMIKDLDISFDETPFAFSECGQIKYGMKQENSFKMVINLKSSFFMENDDFIKNTLKKLSKHSILFDITLLKIQDAPMEEGRFIELQFRKRVKQKFPFHVRKIEIKSETIRDIIGLKKGHDYYSIEDKPCNNGWQYVFYTSDIGYLNLPYIDTLLQRSKLSNNYYIKVFEDNNVQLNNQGNLRIILQRKKAFFKNGVPQVTTRHIAAILRINEDTMMDSYTCGTKNDKIVDLILTEKGLKINDNFIYDELVKNFGEHYDILHLDNPYSKRFFRFTSKSQSQTESKDYMIRKILSSVKNQTLSIDDAEKLLSTL